MLKQIPLTCSGHARPVVSLCFSNVTPDGLCYMMSASKDGLPMLRQGDTGDWIGTFIGHKGAVWGCALNSYATKAATASADFTAKYWNAITGDEIYTFSLSHIVRAVDLDKNGDHMLLTSKNHCYIYDLDRPDADPVNWEAHSGTVKRCTYTDESHNLALTGGEDNKIRLWDLREPLSSHVREIDLGNISFSDFSHQRQWSSAGSTCILTIACGRQIRFYDNQLTLIKQFDAPTIVYSASIAPDGESFVFGGEDFHIYRYRLEDCKEIDNCKGHFGPVHSIRFSPDGEVYASGSEDGTIRLWQTHLGKDYGLWKVDRSIPMATSTEGTSQRPHLVTIGNADSSVAQTAPVVVTPKTPTSPRMPQGMGM